MIGANTAQVDSEPSFCIAALVYKRERLLKGSP